MSATVFTGDSNIVALAANSIGIIYYGLILRAIYSQFSLRLDISLSRSLEIWFVRAKVYIETDQPQMIMNGK